MQWNNFEKFTKFVYTKDPTVTAQQVFDKYIQSLVDITRIRNINFDVAQRVRDLYEKLIVWFILLYLWH